MGKHLATERCELPGGLLIDGQRVAWAELRPVTGVEEEWLAAHEHTPSAEIVTHLLNACLAWSGGLPPNRELAQRLLVGDRNYLMLHLRRLTLGEQMHTVLICPACRAKMDVDFALDAVPVERRPQTAATYVMALESADGTARSVRFRLPTGGDQEAVVDVDTEHAVEVLFRRCLLDDGGAALSVAERDAVIAEMERLAPQVELELEPTCPECGHAFVAPFDITLFFFSEMRANADQLLREVHLLALYYHWSEADILGFTRPRRRAYLSLLSDALRPE